MCAAWMDFMPRRTPSRDASAALVKHGDDSAKLFDARSGFIPPNRQHARALNPIRTESSFRKRPRWRRSVPAGTECEYRTVAPGVTTGYQNGRTALPAKH